MLTNKAAYQISLVSVSQYGNCDLRQTIFYTIQTGNVIRVYINVVYFSIQNKAACFIAQNFTRICEVFQVFLQNNAINAKSYYGFGIYILQAQMLNYTRSFLATGTNMHTLKFILILLAFFLFSFGRIIIVFQKFVLYDYDHDQYSKMK